MDTQRQEFRIGIMVLTCLVCLTLMTVLFGRRPMINFGGEETAIQVRFQRSPGINRNSPVFKNGVQIGRVSRVELVEQDRQVQVSIVLNRNRKIYTDEECRIRQSVIMGEASLEFVKKTNFFGKIEEVDPKTDSYLIGVDSTDLLSGFGNIEGDLSRAIQNVAEAADHLGIFIERLNNVLGTPAEFQAQQARFEAIVNEARQTMFSMRQTTDGINRFVNDPEVQGNVRKLVNDMPDVIERSRVLVGESTLFVQDSRTFIQDTRGLIEKGSVSLDNLSEGLDKVTRTLEVITAIADQVEGDVPEIISAVRRSARQLESLFSELTMIVENFRHADGTVKRLIRDPEAYEKLLVTLDNVEKITDEVDRMLRVDAKPIAHNVKILTDKAARDPAVFIRNLIRKEPPIKPMACCYVGGMFAGSSYTPGISSASFPAFRSPTIIDGEVVEILSETPVRLDRIPSPSASAGRIVNIDPRYVEY